MSLLLDQRGQLMPSGPSSSTSVANTGFSEMDLAAARVLVRRLVQSGLRKGPSDYLLLLDSELDRWYAEEAVRYLHEQGQKRKAPLVLR